MSVTLFGCKIYISLLFVSFLCFIMLIDKSGLMLFGIAAVFVHESGHLAIMRCCKIMPDEIIIQPVGVIIKRSGKICGYYRDMLIAAGGCAANFAVAAVCVILYFVFSSAVGFAYFAAVNISIASFNLMPVSGLDGYDILRNMLCRKLDLQQANNICTLVSLAAISALAVAVTFMIIFCGTNYTMILCVAYLIVLTVINLRY